MRLVVHLRTCRAPEVFRLLGVESRLETPGAYCKISYAREFRMRVGGVPEEQTPTRPSTLGPYQHYCLGSINHININHFGTQKEITYTSGPFSVPVE